MYRHPRVNVTLWMDAYVKQIYPNWVRGGLGLPDLVDVVGRNGGASPSHPASKRIVTVDITEPKVPASKAMHEEFMSALFGNIASSTSAPSKAIKPAASAPLKAIKPAASAPSKAIEPATGIDGAIVNAAQSKAVKPSIVIDLTANTSSLRVRKRKRSLVATVPLVDVSDFKKQEKEERRRKVKRSRGTYVVGEMTGRGTETDPYVL